MKHVYVSIRLTIILLFAMLVVATALYSIELLIGSKPPTIAKLSIGIPIGLMFGWLGEPWITSGKFKD